MFIESVIFDLDGTLTTFNLDYKTLRGQVREYLLHIGVPASILKTDESIFYLLEKSQLYFKNNYKSEKNFDVIRLKCLAIAEEYEMKAALTTTLLTGAFETLDELKERGLKIGLCSMNSEKAVKYILNRFKIYDYFQVIVSRGEIKKLKPDPEQFLIALKSLGTGPNTAIIVGDNKVDMQSARELKALAVGVITGASTRDQLIESGANYVITTLIDLPILIKNLQKN